MPGAARKGDPGDHPGWSAHTITSGSGNVKINGKAAARKGDSVSTHTKGDSSHSSSISGGSGTVKINGRAAARIGDPIACGSKIAGGSGNVNIGG